MAFDESLAHRVRTLLEGQPDVTERRMFGGIAFLVAGNMCCGVLGDDLIVRLDRDTAAELLGSERGVREFDVTGRPMRGWLFVGPDAVAEDEDLAAWVDRAESFASSLPAKQDAG
ncbi:MAG TPA: TfoX/Sxy family protein [Solirubrobacterales bacterium]|nr:TfoX/Sxy family protein [Solirubrobacterales bacterium]